MWFALLMYMTDISSLDVNVAFRQAMTKIGIEDDELLARFHLVLPQSKEKKGRGMCQPTQRSIDSSWNQLGLSYSPKWPLHLLFTASVTEK